MTTLLFPILASLPVEISDGLADKLSTLAGYVLTAGAGGLLVFIAFRSVSAVSGGIRSMITPQPAEQLALEYQGAPTSTALRKSIIRNPASGFPLLSMRGCRLEMMNGCAP